jgi:ubiquinone/menaquinone biosynthesis C-methylase UbiE
MTMEQDHDAVRAAVRDTYAKAAAGCAVSGCCGPNPNASLELGYTPDDLAAVPEGANLGLGCGNPQAIAALRPGETVLDLGSGGGFDCFLAAKQVGPTGRVLGVDMTPAMVTKARANAMRIGAANVEFRLGEIEHLPLADATVDVILSNCVINLSPDKAAVFRDAFRVLRAGGRLAISDVVALAPLPADLRSRVEAFTGCIAGAAEIGDLTRMLQEAGFVDVRIATKPEMAACIADWMPGTGVEKSIASATIEARKPGGPSPCCGPSCCTPGASA